MKGDQSSIPLLGLLWLFAITPPLRGQVNDSMQQPVTKELYRIAVIHIEGNDKTEKGHIFRELTFQTGDRLSPEELNREFEQSRINLVNTSLFLNNHIHFTFQIIPENIIVVTVSVRERWYLWPEPILQNAERNFNTWWLGKDFRKLNWGVDLIKENLWGRDQRLTMALQFGYDEKYELAFNNPMVRSSATTGYGFGFGYMRNREVAYDVYSDQLQFVRADHPLLTRKYLFGQVNYRPNIHHFHTFTLTLDQVEIDSILMELNPGFSDATENRMTLAGFRYLLKIDHRDHKAYPLSGSYMDVEWMQHDIGITRKHQTPYGFIKVNLRKYLIFNDCWHYGAGGTFKISFHREQPFLFERGLGYNREFVRGYEYYVINGHSFILFKQNLKYTLVTPRSVNLGFMPHEKFRSGWYGLYLNLFTDAGYVSGKFLNDNHLVNRWIGGAGIGLDLVTYYDKVIRVEATINDLKKTGIFAHFIAPI